MKTFAVLAGLLLVFGLGISPAQEYVGPRDFLSDHEVDLVRVAQDPNERIVLYLNFARLRLELVRQKLAVEETGRSIAIHRNLQEYGKIIDAIDMVVDDALVRELAIDKGIETLTKMGSEFLAEIEKIAENPPKDHFRYQFVLADAIEITADSIDLAQGELGDRKRGLVEADERDKKKRETLMTPERRADVKEVKGEQEAKEAERKRKRPSLLKPEEKAGKEQQ